jgi:hypothetical protein
MCGSAETTATQCGAQVRMSQAMGFEGVDLSKFKGMPAAEMEAFAIHDGASFLRVHWVAVPEALRARRVNRLAGARDRLLQGARMIIGSPCALLASHGASLTSRFDSQMAKLRHKFTRNWFALWHDPAAPADDLMLLVYEIWVFHDRNGRDG